MAFVKFTEDNMQGKGNSAIKKDIDNLIARLKNLTKKVNELEEKLNTHSH